MKLLAIDTTTDCASVALSVNNVITSHTNHALKQQAQWLLPIINQLLIDAGISVAQLDGLVFSQGPGSFTGLRIACSVAKGLAYAHDLPLYPVSSLQAIAEQTTTWQNDTALQKYNTTLAVIDARMNQVYWGYFKGLTLVGEEYVSAMADIFLTDDEPLLLAGVGYMAYQAQLPTAIARRLIDRQVIYPNASAMLRLVNQGFIKAVDAIEALPKYVRNHVTQGTSNG
jgi:tRNA threonylcarbamoyladenosine biosynthesis protein TsaB